MIWWYLRALKKYEEVQRSIIYKSSREMLRIPAPPAFLDLDQDGLHIEESVRERMSELGRVETPDSESRSVKG